jgi:beta-glucosidase
MNKFPDDFFWGASTSAYQVEGDNFYNDWWEWEQSGGTEASGKACDHYSRYPEDFAIAKELGHNAHRLGLEWSRIEKSEGVYDQNEWDHYKKVLDELNKLGIEPLLTLHHFTLPTWLAQKGGWENPDTIDNFARFAETAVEQLGSKVKYWITINEPLILAFIGYFQGMWPPHKKSFEKILYVSENMIKAHIEAYSRMKNISSNPIEIGLAKAVATFHPCSSYSILDRLSSYFRSNFQDHHLVRSALGYLDFIGLNYYFREFVHHRFPIWINPYGSICSHSHHKDAGKRTNMGWEIYPRGIYEVVKKFSKYKLPIFITENGLSIDDDLIRQEYIKTHLYWLLEAIKEGAPVKGYLHWSLLDNFEWAEGYKQRFGLVGVDFNTQERTIKNSARYYAEVIRSGKVM